MAATLKSSEGQDTLGRTQRNAPIPSTISKDAQDVFRCGLPVPEAAGGSLAERRVICDAAQAAFASAQLLAYGVTMRSERIAGVPVRIFEPRNLSRSLPPRLLINAHGGGFTKDSGSISENVPLVGLTGATVIAVLYRLAPEHPFPAALDDVVSVYMHLLSEQSAKSIGIYGTSAGAILAAQTIVRLQRLEKPIPAALGFFTGSADLSTAGDSEYFFPLIDDPRTVRNIFADYIGANDTTDPQLSPIYSDLRLFPPTLCICGTRDLMLSQTTRFHRALLRAGVDAQLAVFEAMPHSHWSYLELPESAEAFEIMAAFFTSKMRARRVKLSRSK